MGALTSWRRRDLVVAYDSEATSPALLEFESPSAMVIATPVAPAARGVTWVVSLAVISFAAVAGLIPIDKVVTAHGKVVSQNPTIVMQPLDTAIVRAIRVREGQLVHTGEMLAQLDPTIATADLTSLEQQVQSLGAEVNRLQAEADGKPYAAIADDPSSQLQAAVFAQRQAEKNFRLENYRQKDSSIETTIARNLAEASYYRQRLGVAANVEDMRHQLEHMQVGSKLNSLAATDTRLDIARNLATSTAAAEAGKRDLEAMIAERDAYEKNWYAQVLQDLTDRGRKLADASEQLKKAKLHRQLVELRAPQDAEVMTIAKVSVGSVLQPGGQFITLVPTNAPLEVESNVSGGDAGFVHVGDPVAVKFDTFPFTLYGDAEGKVRVVSPDSFTQNQGNSSPDAPQDALPDTRLFYRARVTLDDIKLHDTPPGFRLVPGMPVTADIKVGKRTILSYMLGRVLPVMSEGMREP